MKQVIYSGIIIFLVNLSFGQNNFTINNGSTKYSVVLSVESCDNGNCTGKGIVKLFNKQTNKLFQTVTSEDLFFYFDKTKKPTVNIIELYGEQSPLIFEDFNFDGTEDVAIRNGNHSGYGGPSYDVYVYHITKKQFVPSKELTELATDNLGMFKTDKKRKRLITFQKSGCCWHITREYKVVPKKDLVKVYESEEDEQSKTITTREFINNKWLVKKKKYK